MGILFVLYILGPYMLYKENKLAGIVVWGTTTGGKTEITDSSPLVACSNTLAMVMPEKQVFRSPSGECGPIRAPVAHGIESV